MTVFTNGILEFQVGDKWELTYSDDSVIQGVVHRTVGGRTVGGVYEPKMGFTKRGFLLISENIFYEDGYRGYMRPESARLLFRPHKVTKPGDIITGPEVFNLPIGSVVERIRDDDRVGYTAVLMQDSNRDVYVRRVDANFSWRSLSPELKFQVKYIYK